ncbi:hypothetical protein LXL04_011754 [Taraxacum kok-saghyz]
MNQERRLVLTTKKQQDQTPRMFNKRLTREDDGGWLQLSLGGGHVQSVSHYHRPDHQISLGPRLVELDLLPGGSGGGENWSQQMMMPPLTPPQHLSFQVPDFRASLSDNNAPPTFFLQQHRGSPAASTTIDFSSGSYHGRPIHFQSGLDVSGPPPLMDLRVVDPPRRPHSGVWFILQASQNQTKEPYLPQVPKSYLRIKDGRMTVGLLIKYLVNKLKLDSEFEVEITCKGQQLLPLLTLQHVRDNIWNSPRNEVAVPHSSTTIDHLMLLNYGRIA